MLPSSAIWGVEPTKLYSVTASAAATAAGTPVVVASKPPAPKLPVSSSKEDIERFILQQANGTMANSLLVSEFPHEELVGCLKSLAALEMVSLTLHEFEEFALAPGGEEVLTRNISPEHWFLGKLLASGEFPKKAPTDAFDLLGYKQCIERQWISVKQQEITNKQLPQQDDVLLALGHLAINPPEVQAQLLKRKLVKKVKRTYFSVVPGPKYAREKRVVVADLTKQLLETGDWEKVEMRPFNLHAMGALVQGGTLHPLAQGQGRVSPHPAWDGV
ncbi:phenylalanine-tRNA ligase alpha subunit [Batrachochytrium salamandrivorans]|nr:phenylalanine-tRNA ligase alpha subunit [Batrachochytrium salamandrivorans]